MENGHQEKEERVSAATGLPERIINYERKFGNDEHEDLREVRNAKKHNPAWGIAHERTRKPTSVKL